MEKPREEVEVELELERAVEAVLRSPSRRKLVVAGPGTGKTFLFRRLLEQNQGDVEHRLVLTFINNLKDDLEASLGHAAMVRTLHGYAQSLLRRNARLRGGLSARFNCVPGLTSVVKEDWEHLRGGEAPPFVKQMRLLDNDDRGTFYLQRGDYYDAVDFDDSVFRVYSSGRARPEELDSLELVLIDEYQDFNAMEAGLIHLLADRSDSIVIAGDDDQALYSQLRDASWEHIRSLHGGGEYEFFELPFCMRCPEVIVGAVNDVVSAAIASHSLRGRIPKPYRHYEPVKGADSVRYPRIGLVETSVQRKAKANYFGRFIEKMIRQIPNEEFEEAVRRGEPAVLVIGPKQYRDAVEAYLTTAGLAVEGGSGPGARITRETGLEILNENEESNLGWGILLGRDDVNLCRAVVRQSTEGQGRLVDYVPDEYRGAVLEELALWRKEEHELKQGEAQEQQPIKVTSFEGSKGLAAQHVFILGLNVGDLPRDVNTIQDIEICRFIVGMTRARKKCWLLYTRKFANRWMEPSPFLGWIRPERFEKTIVNRLYWQ